MGYSRGDEIEVVIAREGLTIDAGVGYLPDETMVVIMGAGGKVGESVHATVVGLELTPVGASLVANAQI